MWRDDPATTTVVGLSETTGPNDGAAHYGPVDQGTDHTLYPSSHGVDRSETHKGMSLGTSEFTAINMLKVAGILDFIVAVGIFFPYFSLPLLIYALLWGGATALGRLIGNFAPYDVLGTLEQWLHEALFRIPHAGLLLVALLLEKSLRSNSG